MNDSFEITDKKKNIFGAPAKRRVEQGGGNHEKGSNDITSDHMHVDADHAADPGRRVAAGSVAGSSCGDRSGAVTVVGFRILPDGC